MKPSENKQSENEIPAEKFKNLVNEHLKRELEETIRTLADKVMKEYDLTTLKKLNGNLQTLNLTSQPTKRKSKEDEIPPDKVFVARKSLLSELFEISHIRTIYHIFIVTLIILFLNTVIFDFLQTGRINVGLHLIMLGFGKMSIVIPLWVITQIAVLVPYFSLFQWAKIRIALRKNAIIQRIWDILSILVFTGYQCSLLIFPIAAVLKYELPIASRILILCETVRMVMKVHAFVRSVVPRTLDNKSTEKETLARLPQFSCYSYFLFAPTLVYRDSYPRTGHIKWKIVCLRLTECMLTIFYISFLIERFLIPTWATFGQNTEGLGVDQLVLFIFGSMLPALLTFLCGFYMLLHCWLNATAELLTFADRRFYMDWWNQSRFSAYYRTWNIVVSDWLYTYIYRDIILITRNRLMATMFTFAASALIHEVIMTTAFGFFYPIMFVLFGLCGVPLIFLTSEAHPKAGNIFMWWALAVGNGIMWSLYSMEYYSRMNCSVKYDSVLIDFFIPRSWACQKIILSPDWQFQNPIQSWLI